MTTPKHQPTAPPAHGDVAITSEHDPITGRETIQVHLAGWRVNVAGSYVTVPHQDSTGKSTAALAECLVAAHRLAGTTILGPADTTIRSAQLAAAVIDTLTAAGDIAAQHWSPLGLDIYRCIRDAWQDRGMTAPYTLLVAAVRAALPADTTLLDYNDHADRAEIIELLSRATRQITATTARCGAA